MTDIILLGATGQLGHDLQTVFTQRGLAYTAISRGQFAIDNIAHTLESYTQAKYLINCIAMTNVDGCEVEPNLALQLNSSLVYSLAQWAQQHNIIIIHFSTDYIFAGKQIVDYTETTPAQPLNMYGISKYAGDLAIQAYTSKYFIFRVAALFGIAKQAQGNFISNMLNLNADESRTSLSIIADQYTTPTHTLDVARCVTHFIQQDIHDYGIYNCVSQGSCSWYQFTQYIFKELQLNATKLQAISYSEYKFKAQRPQYVILNNSKLAKYYTMPNWQQAVTEYLENSR